MNTASREWEVAYRSLEHDVEDRIAKIRHFQLNKAQRVLDLGCGDGIDLKAFRHLGFEQVFGIDISASLLRDQKDYSILSSDVYSIGLRNSCVDVVYGNNVLHHFRCLEQAIEEIRRVLCDGGFFCFAEPKDTFFRSMVDFITLSPMAKISKTLQYRRIILEEEKDDYEHWLAKQKELFGIIERAGFRLVEAPNGIFRLFAKWEAI